MTIELPKIRKGYVDIRRETCETLSFEVKNHRLENYLDINRKGCFYRVADVAGFRQFSNIIDASPPETSFSRFIKNVYEKQGDGIIKEDTLHPPLTSDASHLKMALLELADHEISFSFISENRNLEFRNSLQQVRRRTERLNLIKIFAKRRTTHGHIQLRSFLRNCKVEDLARQTKILKEKLDELGNPKPIAPAQMDVILHPTVSSLMIHELFGHHAEWDRWSPLSQPTFGVPLANPNVTIEDVPNDSHNWNYFEFDDEGIDSKPVTLLEKGIFVNALHSLESAFRTHSEPNGRGRAKDFRYRPRSRMMNLRMAPGEQSTSELMKTIKDGIYVVGSYGGIFSSGLFQICCQYGYRIQNGKILEPILQPIINGSTAIALTKISGVANDFEWVLDGGCYSEEQFLLTSGRGGPHILMNQVYVS